MRAPSSLTHRLTGIAVGLVVAVTAMVSAVTWLAVAEVTEEQLDADARAAVERAVSNFAGLQPELPGPGPPNPLDLGPGDRGGRGSDDRGDGPRGSDDQDRDPSLLSSVQAVFPASGDGTSGSARGSYANGRGDVFALDVEQLSDLASAIDTDARGRRGGDVELIGLGEFQVDQRTARDAAGGIVTVVAGVSTQERDDTLRQLLVWELLLLLAAAAAALLLASLLVRRTLRPLREVATVAHDVAELPLDQGEVARIRRVPDTLTDPKSEVGQVGAALNRMLVHVEASLAARHESEQQVRQFVADASHELRTPLTTIRGYAELAGRNPDALPMAMSKVTEESARMAALVEDLLLLARLDSGRPLERGVVDLTALCIGAVDDARVVGRDHRWLLTLPEEPIEVPGDELRLHQVLTNLLTNARRHTPEGTTVTVQARRLPGGRVEIVVSDDGPGLPDGVDVFDRFARGDSSRTRASGGVGLGLALVRAIVEAHGGRVTAQSSAQGSEFVVQLPSA